MYVFAYATGRQDFPVAHVLEDELVRVDAFVHRRDVEAHAKDLARLREIRAQCILAFDPPRWIGERLLVHEIVGPRPSI
jgi:hypothetical protein